MPSSQDNSEPTTLSPSAPAPTPGAQPSSPEYVFANLGIVVLAGGKSTRMGADKAKDAVGGRGLIAGLGVPLPPPPIARGWPWHLRTWGCRRSAKALPSADRWRESPRGCGSWIPNGWRC